MAGANAPGARGRRRAPSHAAWEKQKAAEAAKTEAEKKLAAATKAAAPTDRVDIHVSTPIHIKVNPKAEATVAKTDSKP